MFSSFANGWRVFGEFCRPAGVSMQTTCNLISPSDIYTHFSPLTGFLSLCYCRVFAKDLQVTVVVMWRYMKTPDDRSPCLCDAACIINILLVKDYTSDTGSFLVSTCSSKTDVHRAMTSGPEKLQFL